MFDIGAEELLVVVVVAILVIGPKDMPAALRTVGRWVGKMRKVSSHFRTGLDAMIREAEMEDMEKKWKAQNEKIMQQYPQGNASEMQPTGAYPAVTDSSKPAGEAKPVTLAEATAAETTAAEGASAESAVTPPPAAPAPPADKAD